MIFQYICQKKLGEYLQKVRHARRLTQKEVADYLGYSGPQFISNIERGKSAVPIPVLRELLHFYLLDKNEIIKIILKEEKRYLKKSLG